MSEIRENKFGSMTPGEIKKIAESRKKTMLAIFRKEMPEFEKVYRLIPKSRQTLFLKVLTGQSSDRERIKLKCLECNGYQEKQIGTCPDKSCALWKSRPYQNNYSALGII